MIFHNMQCRRAGGNSEMPLLLNYAELSVQPDLYLNSCAVVMTVAISMLYDVVITIT